MNEITEDIKKVIRLDAIGGFFKLFSIAFIPIILINMAMQASMWYLSIFADIISILIYKLRANFIKKQFKSYDVIYGEIIGMNILSYIQGTRTLTYSYEYNSKQYKNTSSIADFLRNSYSVTEGSLIKIVVNTENPSKAMILSLY